jgi:hypothetical protein
MLRKRIKRMRQPNIRGGDRRPTARLLRVLIANERTDRLARVAAPVVALGHEVIAREIEVGRRTGHLSRAARRRARRSRRELRARAQSDRQDRPRGSLPSDRAPPRARPGFRQGSVEARRLCPHQRRRRRRLAELDRHRAAPLRRIPRPPRGIRASRHDRTGQGRPDGTPLDRRGRRL